MSPEQVRSAKNVDHRADVFALGCILYELVCDQRAFVGEDSLEVFNRVTQGRFRPPREAVRGLPPRLEAAIFGALAINVDERIPNCETLARVVRGELTWARPSAIDVTFDGSQFEGEPNVPPPAARPAASPVQTLALRGTVTLAGGEAVVDAVASPASGKPASSRGWGVVALVGLGLFVLLCGVVGWMARPGAVERPETVGSVPTPAPAAAEAALTVPDAPPAAAPAPGPEVEAPRAPRSAPPARASGVAGVQPPPEVPTAHTGHVVFTGDARQVQLRTADGARLPAGEVPPGSYVIEASFDAGSPMHAGNLVIRAGQRVTLDCRSSTLSCSPP
jgi:serine/threonine-protein kinase